MKTFINFISETNNGGWAELQKRWRPFIIKRLAKKTLLSSAEAKERKTSDAILCPFVLILQQAQHKYKRTKKSSGDDPYQERKHLHIF